MVAYSEITIKTRKQLEKPGQNLIDREMRSQAMVAMQVERDDS